MNSRVLLTISGWFSLLAGSLHIGMIFFDASGYFGAPDEVVAYGKLQPVENALMLCAIAAMLFVFSAYAFSGAKKIRRLPFLMFGLLGIGALYFLRGLVAFPQSFSTIHFVAGIAFRHSFHDVVISLIVLSAGIIHLLGCYFLFKERKQAPAITSRI